MMPQIEDVRSPRHERADQAGRGFAKVVRKRYQSPIAREKRPRRQPIVGGDRGMDPRRSRVKIQDGGGSRAVIVNDSFVSF